MATGHTRSTSIIKHFECPICIENLKIPRSLPKCLHNFCHECLVGYLTNIAKQSDLRYQCPVCREDIDINCSRTYKGVANWVKDLPINHMVVSLLDELSGKEISSCGNSRDVRDTIPDESCPLHDSRPLEYLCVDHDELLCDSCFVKSHRRCANVEDIETVVKGIADSKSRHELNDRISKVREAINKSGEEARNNVGEIENAEMKIERQISDFKDKLKVLNSLAEQFEKETLKASKVTSTQLYYKTQMDLGIGINWLLSLQEADKKYTKSNSSAVQIVQARRSLLDVVANCENYVDNKTPLNKPLFSLEIYQSLDNLITDGFGTFLETGVNVLKSEAPRTETPTLQCDSYPEPTAGPSRLLRAGRTEVANRESVSDQQGSLKIIRVDTVHIDVPHSKVPHFIGATYLPDNRVVLADGFHKRLVLLDHKFGYQSYIDLAPKKPTNVAYIGDNELAVSLMTNEFAEDQFAIVKVQGKQMVVDREFNVGHFDLRDIAAINDEWLLVCTFNNAGNYCLSEMSLENGKTASKLRHVNGEKLECINGFTVDMACRPRENEQRIYIHRGCDDCSNYRLVCTNMVGQQIFVYSNHDLAESSNGCVATDLEGNVYLCNEKNIHVVSKDGQNITTIHVEYDDIMAIAFNKKKDKFIITNNAWKDRKVIAEFSVKYEK